MASTCILEMNALIFLKTRDIK